MQEPTMSLSSDIKRVLEIFNATRDDTLPYREFEKPPLRSPETTYGREGEGSLPSSPSPAFGFQGLSGKSGSSSVFLPPPQRSRKVFRPLEAPQATGGKAEEWPGLKAAVSDLIPALPSPSSKWPLLVLCSLAGGSGRSTLSSVLAIENARHGRPCLLIDLNETSLYPYLFMNFRQEESIRMGRSWTFHTYEPTGIPMVVVRPDPEELRGDEESGALSRLRDEIVSQAAGIFGHSGHPDPFVLIDSPPMTRQDLKETLRISSMFLSPVRPDLPSLVSVKDMEKSFDRLEREENRYCERFYVLNRFIPDHPLHQDIYEIIRQILSRRLCPFVIPEDSTVELAQARGESLLDVFSETSAAISMAEVSRWISAKLAG
jgi:cellulose biosynthesis protein BcsQ